MGPPPNWKMGVPQVSGWFNATPVTQTAPLACAFAGRTDPPELLRDAREPRKVHVGAVARRKVTRGRVFAPVPESTEAGDSARGEIAGELEEHPLDRPGRSGVTEKLLAVLEVRIPGRKQVRIETAAVEQFEPDSVGCHQTPAGPDVEVRLELANVAAVLAEDEVESWRPDLEVAGPGQRSDTDPRPDLPYFDVGDSEGGTGDGEPRAIRDARGEDGNDPPGLQSSEVPRPRSAVVLQR